MNDQRNAKERKQISDEDRWEQEKEILKAVKSRRREKKHKQLQQKEESNNKFGDKTTEKHEKKKKAGGRGWESIEKEAQVDKRMKE